jgi:hypothetical protein
VHYGKEFLLMRKIKRVTKDRMLTLVKREKKSPGKKNGVTPNPFERYGGLLDKSFLALRVWDGIKPVEVCAEHHPMTEMEWVATELKRSGWNVRLETKRVDSSSTEYFLIIS